MKAARSIIIALVPLALFVHAADPSTAGEALFERAVTAAEHGSYPRYATYAVDVSFTNGSHHVTDMWDTTEDITHAAVYASIFSRQEHAAPFVPRGINLKIGGMVINAQQPNDPIGPVAFAADQDFGVRPPHAYAVVDDGETFATTGSGLAVIGRSGTELQRYAVTLLDADATSDHLALTPLRDPYHNRLRELWIDPTDASVQEAVVAGIGDRAPLDKIPWDVLFVQNAGGTYIAEEDALAPLDYGKSGHLQHARVTFDDLTLSSRFPLTYTFGIETPVQSQHDP